MLSLVIGNFLGEVGELASDDLLPKEKYKNIVNWYNEKTKNSTIFDDDIWFKNI